jgi:hypothetical protein
MRFAELEGLWQFQEFCSRREFDWRVSPAPASWTAVAERNGDTAFDEHESGVALRFPPHSKTSRTFPAAFKYHGNSFE